jgi:hypothetical protein
MNGARAGGREGLCLLVGTGNDRRLLQPLLAGVPGLVHAFTTRGTDPSRAFAAAAGRAMPLASLHQTHGRRIHAVEDRDALPAPGRIPVGDALISRRRGVGLLVSVADCVPALVCDPVSGWIGAVHAGWRGTVAGVLAGAIRALLERGARSADLLVALGPSIGRCCYSVGPEVAAAFRDSWPGAEDAVLAGDPAHVDLIEANRRQALHEGVAPERIAAAGLCTACRPDLLESHRRSRGSPGRTAAFIAWAD